MRDMHEFDQQNAEALKRLWFLGDVHGEFRHLAAALKMAATESSMPSWLVFLGDVEIFDRSFKDIMAPVRKVFPSVQVAFIHGNHDADDYDHWEALHDCGDAVALHGHVVSLDGIMVAGLGGNFLGRVWAPPTTPTFLNKTKAMERGPYGWRDGQRPSPRFHGAVYPDDVSHLAGRRADILITHEAPGCHHHGWDALSQLARDMGVIRSFHGHTHDDLSENYALLRDQLGFDARAVNFCNIKNGLGELVSGPPLGMEDWS